jgi:hypothetical protein
MCNVEYRVQICGNNRHILKKAAVKYFETTEIPRPRLLTHSTIQVTHIVKDLRQNILWPGADSKPAPWRHNHDRILCTGFSLLLTSFLGVFAKSRKATISLVMSVLRPDNSAPTGRVFMEFDI